MEIEKYKKMLNVEGKTLGEILFEIREDFYIMHGEMDEEYRFNYEDMSDFEKKAFKQMGEIIFKLCQPYA